MESKENRVRNVVLGVLAVSLIGLTVAYAQLTQRLNINGTAKSKSNTWDIHFENLKSTVTGNAVLSQDNPLTIVSNSTTISGSVGNLSLPGDSIVYTFDIANKGTISAQLSADPIISTPECSSNDATGATVVCENVIYTLTYADGSKIKTGDILEKGEKKAVKLTLSLKNSMSAVPSAEVDITNIAAVLNYNQKN
jgi:hypothetical protein